MLRSTLLHFYATSIWRFAVLIFLLLYVCVSECFVFCCGGATWLVVGTEDYHLRRRHPLVRLPKRLVGYDLSGQSNSLLMLI